jgi:hypothetical protein
VAEPWIADAITVPAAATLVVVSRDAPLYLMEDRSLGLLASSDDAIEAVCSYEEIA